MATSSALAGNGEQRSLNLAQKHGGVGRAGNEATECRWAQQQSALPARLGCDQNRVRSHGGLRQGLQGKSSCFAKNTPAAGGQQLHWLGRAEARWETCGKAGFMVQERGDDGFSQEIEQRGRELWFIDHLLCAGHCTGHFSSILSLLHGIFIMPRLWGQPGS